MFFIPFIGSALFDAFFPHQEGAVVSKNDLRKVHMILPAKYGPKVENIVVFNGNKDSQEAASAFIQMQIVNHLLNTPAVTKNWRIMSSILLEVFQHYATGGEAPQVIGRVLSFSEVPNGDLTMWEEIGVEGGRPRVQAIRYPVEYYDLQPLRQGLNELVKTIMISLVFEEMATENGLIADLGKYNEARDQVLKLEGV